MMMMMMMMMMMNYSKFMMNDDDQYQTEQRIKSPEDDCGLALTHRHGNFR